MRKKILLPALILAVALCACGKEDASSKSTTVEKETTVDIIKNTEPATEPFTEPDTEPDTEPFTEPETEPETVVETEPETVVDLNVKPVYDDYSTYEEYDAARDAYYANQVSIALSEGRQVVYLTFDDGSSTLTPTVLDTLDSYGVNATFFVVGAYCDRSYAETMYPEIMKRGNSLGFHTYTHSRANIYASFEAFQSDVDTMYQYVYEITGTYPYLFRFPGGTSTSFCDLTVMLEQNIPYITSLGCTYYDWNVSAGDSGSDDQDKLYNAVITGITGKSESVVLMHDGAGHDATVAMLPRLLDTLINDMNCLVVPITRSTTPVQSY